MPVDLESLTGSAFSKIDEKLGDTMTVTAPATAPSTFKGNINFNEATADFGGANAVRQAISGDFAMDRVTGKPGAGWMVEVAAIPGKQYLPINVQRDQSGTRWEFELKEIKA